MVGQILILRIRETMKWLSIMASKQTGPFHDLVVNYCCSVTQSCPTLCNLIDCSTPVFPVLPHLLKFAQTHVHYSVMPSNHLILCHPLLLPLSIFPSIRVFSNELALHIRWPKYWSFSFSIQSFQWTLAVNNGKRRESMSKWRRWEGLPQETTMGSIVNPTQYN